jgi:hypothetical protein
MTLPTTQAGIEAAVSAQQIALSQIHLKAFVRPADLRTLLEARGGGV